MARGLDDRQGAGRRGVDGRDGQLHPAGRAARRGGAPRQLRHPPLPAALPPDLDGRDRPARRGGVRPRRHAAARGVGRAVRARARVGAHRRAGRPGRLGLPGALPRPGRDRRLGGGGRGAARGALGRLPRRAAAAVAGGRARGAGRRAAGAGRRRGGARGGRRAAAAPGARARPARARGRSTPRCGGPGAHLEERWAAAGAAGRARGGRRGCRGSSWRARSARRSGSRRTPSSSTCGSAGRGRCSRRASRPAAGRGGVRLLRPGAPHARVQAGGRRAAGARTPQDRPRRRRGRPSSWRDDGGHGLRHQGRGGGARRPRGVAAAQRLRVPDERRGRRRRASPSSGPDYEDGSGRTYLPMLRQPVLVFESPAAKLRTVYDRAVARELRFAVFTADLFATGHDDDNRAAVRAVPSEALDLVGLAVRAPHKAVDGVVRGLEAPSVGSRRAMPGMGGRGRDRPPPAGGGGGDVVPHAVPAGAQDVVLPHEGGRRDARREGRRRGGQARADRRRPRRLLHHAALRRLRLRARRARAASTRRSSRSCSRTPGA